MGGVNPTDPTPGAPARQLPTMSLSQLPLEIIENLSEHIILTDLVLLHACGNSALNEKLRDARLTLRVLTLRCDLYLNEAVTRRFEKAVTFLYKVDSYNQPCCEYIPCMVKKVFVPDSYIISVIPKSVDEMVVDFLGTDAVFERAPGELAVAAGFSVYGATNAYITHLTDYQGYHESMVNLKSVDVPGFIDDVDFGKDVVQIVCAKKCGHGAGIHPRERIPGNMWSVDYCTICKKKLTVQSTNGIHCEPIPQCETLHIMKHNVDDVRLLLGAAADRIESDVIIEGTVQQLNKFCESGGLGLISSRAREVTLCISRGESSGGPHNLIDFVGIEKSYPFIVHVKAHESALTMAINIINWKGIDKYTCTSTKPEHELKALLRKNPRLSIAH